MARTKGADRTEELRVRWERDLERRFPWAEARERKALWPDYGANDRRIRLEEAMASRVHRVAREAAERLGFSAPYVLYQTPRARSITAQALCSESPFAVRLVGPVSAYLDDASLATLIGHELGHALAHGVESSKVLEAWSHGATAPVAHLCTAMAELTADRFGLVAAGGDLDASVRLDAAIELCDSPSAMGLQERAYLDGLKARVDRGEDVLLHKEHGYPTSAFRLYAAWLFWQSDVHRELTGVGPGALSLEAVDARVKELYCRQYPWPPERVARTSQVAVAPRPKASPNPPIVEDTVRGTETTFDGAVRDAAASVVSALGKWFRDETPVVVDADPAHMADASFDEDVDDLESRFRALEARAASVASGRAPEPVDDLEARFLALEAKDREG